MDHWEKISSHELLDDEMTTAITIELGDADTRQLDDEAARRDLTRAAMAARWVEERLLHERERAAGRTKPAVHGVAPEP